MKNHKNLFLFVTLIILLSGCNTVEVVEYRPGVDAKTLTAFKTFSFYQLHVTGTRGPNFAANYELGKQVIASEMTSRGFTEVAEGGELLVNLGVIIESKNQSGISEEAQFMSEPDYTWENKPRNQEKLTVGTITIEMVDASKKTGVWIGSVTGAAPPNEAVKQERIRSAITLLFKEFPVKVKS